MKNKSLSQIILNKIGIRATKKRQVILVKILAEMLVSDFAKIR